MQTYVPRNLISNYPDTVNGTSSGLHYHIYVTRAATDPRTGKEVRLFVNPLTLNATDLSWMTFAYREGKTINLPIKQTVTRRNITIKKAEYLHIGSSDTFFTGWATSTVWYTDYETQYESRIEWYVNTDSNDRIKDTDENGWIEYKPF